MLTCSQGGLDVESLERENERGLDTLSERVGLLKAVSTPTPNVDSDTCIQVFTWQHT